tara:strand:- start:1815 stop:2306 length:492 start_codon:yes stop_codon:yes gene_type:complete
MNLEDLSKEIPFKWRVQSTKFGKTTCVAYIDARDCMDILDKVCGPENWQSIFYEANGLLFCKVGICCDSKDNESEVAYHQWVWKSDTGSESKVEKDKGHVSDAFKRACVKWGIGRFLYRLPIQTLQTKQWKGKDYPYAPEKDKIIFDGNTLTKYINWKIKNNK